MSDEVQNGRGDRTNYFRLYYLRNKERIRAHSHAAWRATTREERNTLYRAAHLQAKYRAAGLRISRADARKILGIDRPRKVRARQAPQKWADMSEDERRIIVYLKKCRECGLRMTHEEARRIMLDGKERGGTHDAGSEATGQEAGAETTTA